MKTLEWYVESINKLLADAHAAGHELFVDTGTAREHPWPAINPCADGGQWKQWVRGVAEYVATDCRCCNGMRILVAGIAGVALGMLL